ncbi:MAG: hypothetical protein U5O39_03645 [Gammaproteobacteria bacterium]|nr:hypothetical protein [Gammaproteobacteria bacterium]
MNSFLTYARGLYFWLALALALVCVIAYLIHDARPEPNGGSWLGYTLGGIGAFMILWLMYLGRRKRNFSSSLGNVRGWVSAHVYFGIALVVVATFHTGFQFGMNIHTLAYVMTCLVVLSGLYGVWAYRTYPEARNNLKKSLSLDDVFAELEENDLQLRRLVSNAPGDIREAVQSAIDRTEVGGGLLDQLTGRDNSRMVVNGEVRSNGDQKPLIDFLVRRLSEATGETSEMLADAVKSCGARQKFLRMIRRDIRMHGLQEIWLVFHVPLSFGLLAALIAHVVSVFIYW